MKERISSEELRQRLELEGIMDVIRRGRLRWYGHVMRKQDEDWVTNALVWKWMIRSQEGDQNSHGWIH